MAGETTIAKAMTSAATDPNVTPFRTRACIMCTSAVYLETTPDTVIRQLGHPHHFTARRAPQDPCPPVNGLALHKRTDIATVDRTGLS